VGNEVRQPHRGIDLNKQSGSKRDVAGELSGGSRLTHIVSEDWVRQSTTAYSTFDPQTNYDAPHEYGFGWHINHLQVGNRVFRAYSAGGNGGQIIMVIPDLDLVVSINGGSYGEFTKWYRWGLQLVPQYILDGISARPLPSNEAWSQVSRQIGGQISGRMRLMDAWRKQARPLVDSHLTYPR
jgi:CubicO group peptidase (beta-lactamase class C family)